MIAAAYGEAASMMSRTNRSRPATSRVKPDRQGRRIGIETEAQDAPDRRGPRREPLEIRPGHGAVEAGDACKLGAVEVTGAGVGVGR